MLPHLAEKIRDLRDLGLLDGHLVLRLLLRAELRGLRDLREVAKRESSFVLSDRCVPSLPAALDYR